MQEFTLLCRGITFSGLRSAGTSEHDPILGLHGWLDNAASFTPLCEKLPDWSIHAIDLPGHGHSDHLPALTGYHFFDWTGLVLDAADRLGFARFGIIGHSMGAGIASMIAGTFPERVSFVIAIEGLGAIPAADDELPERLKANIAATRRKSSSPPARYDSVSDALEVRIKAGDFATTDGIRKVVERGLVKDDKGYYWRSDPKLRWPSAVRFSEDQIVAFLKRVCCPFLIIRADQGLDIMGSLVQKFLDAIPHRELHQVKGHHHVHLDDPDSVAPIVDSFLRRLLKADAAKQ